LATLFLPLSPDLPVATTVVVDTAQAFQQCLSPDCGATFDVGEVHTACPKCGWLLDIAYDWVRRPPAECIWFLENILSSLY
jgi:threonine synthase